MISALRTRIPRFSMVCSGLEERGQHSNQPRIKLFCGMFGMPTELIGTSHHSKPADGRRTRTYAGIRNPWHVTLRRVFPTVQTSMQPSSGVCVCSYSLCKQNIRIRHFVPKKRKQLQRHSLILQTIQKADVICKGGFGFRRQGRVRCRAVGSRRSLSSVRSSEWEWVGK
jgi:hypothetical protein